VESVRLALSRGYWSWIDEADYPRLSRFNWHINDKKNGPSCKSGLYAQTSVAGYGKLSLHTLIMDTPPGMVVDHINGDGLDNRRDNLRIVTPEQNHLNKSKRKYASSKFKGVHWDSTRGGWLVKIKRQGAETYLGFFDSETEAALAYNEGAKMIHGEYARLNVIPLTDIAIV
jgi:hypothetical protein